jgi:hypothetical protein
MTTTTKQRTTECPEAKRLLVELSVSAKALVAANKNIYVGSGGPQCDHSLSVAKAGHAECSRALREHRVKHLC